MKKKKRPRSQNNDASSSSSSSSCLIQITDASCLNWVYTSLIVKQLLNTDNQSPKKQRFLNQKKQNQYVKREGVKEKINPSTFNSNKYLTKKFIQPNKYTNGLTGSYKLPTHTMFDTNKQDKFLLILGLLILELQNDGL